MGGYGFTKTQTTLSSLVIVNVSPMTDPVTSPMPPVRVSVVPLIVYVPVSVIGAVVTTPSIVERIVIDTWNVPPEFSRMVPDRYSVLSPKRLIVELSGNESILFRIHSAFR